MVFIPDWEQFATDQTDPDQTDPLQIAPRRAFTPYDCLFITVAFVVLIRVCCSHSRWLSLGYRCVV